MSIVFPIGVGAAVIGTHMHACDMPMADPTNTIYNKT